MGEHPYRAAPIASSKRLELAEGERPPTRTIRVRGWSDGTTRIRVGAGAPAWRRFGLLAVAVVVLLFAPRVCSPLCTTLGPLAFFAAFYCLWRAARAFAVERIEVTPAAVLLRRGSGRARVLPRADVGTVVVVGNGHEVQLLLQVGRERLPIADGLGHDEAALRFVAQRLRRALEAAR